jgi:hypothetical protein
MMISAKHFVLNLDDLSTGKLCLSDCVYCSYSSCDRLSALAYRRHAYCGTCVIDEYASALHKEKLMYFTFFHRRNKIKWR